MQCIGAERRGGWMQDGAVNKNIASKTTSKQGLQVPTIIILLLIKYLDTCSTEMHYLFVLLRGEVSAIRVRYFIHTS